MTLNLLSFIFGKTPALREIKEGLEVLVVNENGTYTPTKYGFSKVIVNVGGEKATVAEGGDLDEA